MENIAKLLFESGALKLIPRSGWFKIGIKEPETVAEHSFRTALIAFIITKIETGSHDKAVKAAFLGLIHDLHESRTLDLHKMAKRYASIDYKEIKEEHAKILGIEEFIVAEKNLMDFVEDADKLELLIQAKEYSEQYPSAMVYVENLEFKFDSSKILADAIKNSDQRWWMDFEVHL
jgi:putative hydrolase of HD superfamily